MTTTAMDGTYVLLLPLLIALRGAWSATLSERQLPNSLLCCNVVTAFFSTGLSRLLLLATLSSSCFFDGVRRGKPDEL